MAFTFTTHKTAIQDYSENTETTFTNNLTRFILNSEERILKECQLEAFRKNSTGTTPNGVKFLSMPTDFLAPFSLSVITGNNYYFLLNKDVNYLQEAYPDTTETVRPQFYAIFYDTNLLVAPVPDAAYTVEFHYLYQPAGISASNTTTWLSTNASNALLYASLIEAYLFMKGEADLMTYYQTRYQECLPRV